METPHDIVESLKTEYRSGDRVRLLNMNDPDSPPIGTFGTVLNVDDIGTIHVKWDNGSCLGCVYGEDSLVKINSVENYLNNKNIKDLKNIASSLISFIDEQDDSIKSKVYDMFGSDKMKEMKNILNK